MHNFTLNSNTFLHNHTECPPLVFEFLLSVRRFPLQHKLLHMHCIGNYTSMIHTRYISQTTISCHILWNNDSLFYTYKAFDDRSTPLV